MSRAFTKDGAEQDEVVIPPRAPLPEGAANYVTASGLRALRDEHAALTDERRRAEAREAEDPDRARAVAVATGKLAALEERLASAQLVGPPAEVDGPIRFGATVIIRHEDGRERTYRIVGVDEADAEQGRLAFVAPLARALLGNAAGEEVVVRTPRGPETVEIVRVMYEGAAARGG